MMASPAMRLAPGTRLGRYEVRSLLGAGGMGEVYLAHDTTLRRAVAIKVLPNEAAQDRDRLRRFEQEAHAASSLNHPNILTIHEVGAHDGTLFVATEFLDGESLRARMARAAAALMYAVYSGFLVQLTGKNIDSVAVLPVSNETGDPDHEYLSDGITDALINSLSQLSGVKVIARSSSFQYKGKAVVLQEVARAPV